MNGIVLRGFEPRSTDPKSAVIGHYTIGLREWKRPLSVSRPIRVRQHAYSGHSIVGLEYHSPHSHRNTGTLTLSVQGRYSHSSVSTSCSSTLPWSVIVRQTTHSFSRTDHIGYCQLNSISTVISYSTVPTFSTIGSRAKTV